MAAYFSRCGGRTDHSQSLQTVETAIPPHFGKGLAKVRKRSLLSFVGIVLALALQTELGEALGHDWSQQALVPIAPHQNPRGDPIEEAHQPPVVIRTQ